MLFLLLACPTTTDDSKIPEGTNAGECSDTLDNDSDGVIDCDEEDCTEACTTPSNNPPGPPEVAIEPAEPGLDDTLTCIIVTDSVDSDGDNITYKYKWEVDGTDAQISTSSVSGVATEAGQTWTCIVTPNDGTDDGTPGSAEVTMPGKANTPPGAPTVRVTPELPEDDDPLRCEIVVDAVDPDGDTITYQYSWEVDGVDAGISDPIVNANLTSERETWECFATAFDGTDFGGTGSDFVEIQEGGGGGQTGTGFAVISWTGEVTGDGQTLSSGDWSYGFHPYEYNSNTWDATTELCRVSTPLQAGNLRASCPGCDFVYETEGTTGGAATGSECTALGNAGAALVYYPDLYAGYGLGFGFVSNYAGYGIAGMYLYLESYASYGFFLFNFDYPPYYYVTINRTDAEWTRIIRDQNSGYPFYYQY